MVVNTFEEAKPIVLAEMNKGKKVGGFYPAGSVFHDGYKALLKETRKHCDFVIATATEHSRDAFDNEYKWLSLWKGMPDHDPYLESGIISLDMVKEMEKEVDLVIRENNPLPTDLTLTEELKNLVEVFISESEKYIKFDRQSVRDMFWAVLFASKYYVAKTYFAVPIQVMSYKEGLVRFIQRKLYPTYLNREIIFIDPVRDEHGLVLSSTRCRNEMSKKEITNYETLRKLTDGHPIVTSKDETANSLSDRLNRIGWSVKSFTKHTGDLLQGNEEAYIHIVIANGNFPPSQIEGDYSKGVYIDGFLFKKM